MSHPPPFLMTSEPGSFARETIEVRKAQIIAAAVADWDYPPNVRASLNNLAAEIAGGHHIAPPASVVPLQAEWEAARGQWAGRGWLQVQWYFAEAYFYVRLLDAIGYFAGLAPDPFAKRKQALLAQSAAILPSLVAADAVAAALPRTDAWALLVRRSLWGNRLDLSNEAILARHVADASHMDDTALLVDDSATALAAIDAAAGRPVLVICDNSGPELVCDLHLVDWLLRHAPGPVSMMLKAQPFFVSDAMVVDAQATIAYLAGRDEAPVAALGGRLARAVTNGRLRLCDHPFFTGPGFYTLLPPDLYDEFARSALVIAKGDVNYRRFLEDRHWPFDAPIHEVVRGVPAQAFLLRTLKGELAAGLPPSAIAQAKAEGNDWLIAGRHGVAQFVRRDKATD